MVIFSVKMKMLQHSEQTLQSAQHLKSIFLFSVDTCFESRTYNLITKCRLSSLRDLRNVKFITSINALL